MISWFCFALVLSLYNKWMFDKNRYGFPYPLFVTCLHMWIQFALATFVRFTWPATFRPEGRPNVPDYCKKAVPTAVSTAVDIGFSNWSLKLITLSLYTMVKSSTLVFVLIFAFLFRLESPSIRLILVVLFIFAGVFLSVAAETTIVVPGLVLILIASACAGLRWSLTQVLLKKSPKMGMNNPAATLFWLTPSMGITLAIISMVLEGWGNVFRLPFFESDQLLKTIGIFVFPGCLAFCMVLSEYYIILRTGVVPMSIAGIFKEVMTLSASAYIFGDHLNPVNLTGVVITFLGIGVFVYHKYRKSLDSTVPLDAHGNPIPVEDGDEDAAAVIAKAVEEEGSAEERQHLPRFMDSEDGHEGERGPSNPTPKHVLFSATDLDFSLVSPSDTRRPGYSAKHSDQFRIAGGEHDALARESLDIQREWRTQSPSGS